MKSHLLGALTIAGAAAALSLVVVAGPLNPPAGPVAGTHKTLSEVEPRTAINGANTPGNAESLFRITQPGSYYLAGNVTAPVGKNGIEVASSGVTIDLNGFELVGTPGFMAVHGIVSTAIGLDDITVRNGTVRDWPGQGVSLSGLVVTGGLLSNINARDNVGTGLFVHSYFRVVECSASGNGGDGIWAVNSSIILACTSSGNGENGIRVGSGHTLKDCVSYGNGGGGILAGEAATIVHCSAYSNDEEGILVSGASLVSGCVVRSNSGDGILAGTGCTISGNSCTSNGFQGGDGAGILVLGNDGRVENNQCEGNDRGVDVDGSRNRIDGNSCTANSVSFTIGGADNIVIRNTASGGSPNYSITAGNSVAPRVSVADSDGWAGINNANHPFANFGY